MTARDLARLPAREALALGALGLRARRVRAALSALGIAIAVAAMVAVLGIAASAQADLLTELGTQGNLLTVASGQTFDGNPTPLPATAEAMIGRIPPVQSVTAVGTVPGATVRRTAAIPAIDTGGISVLAAETSLLGTVSGALLRGQFLGEVSRAYPQTVLGYSAARTLGIDALSSTTQVYLGDRYFVVIGVLAPISVAPEIDDAALVSFPVADTLLGLGGHPTRIYLRVDPERVGQVVAVLPFTASPDRPEAVSVRRPSDVLLARIKAKTAFVGLFLGLGAVALLVAGVGVANIMVISVLERRGEIGLRRAFGARRRDVAAQFLLESALLAGGGGALGVGLGCVATAVAAHLGHNSLAIPPQAPLAGLGAALCVGVLAGVYPALRAARLAPAEALRSL
jgi:putative ABC transport system permease protein